MLAFRKGNSTDDERFSSLWPRELRARYDAQHWWQWQLGKLVKRMLRQRLIATGLVLPKKEEQIQVNPANQEITRCPESEVAMSFTLETGNVQVNARPTISNPASKLFISFVGGLCAGRDGVVLEKTEAVFGRGDDCDVKLDGDTVSRYHCKIKRIGNAFLVEDTSRNGTYLNDERIASAQLRDQDQLRVGQNILLIHLSSSTGTGALTSKNTTPNLLPYLLELKPHIVVKGLEIGVTQPFGEDRITIGRRGDNHLVLDYDNISRQHLCIERKDEQYIATDMGSSNGTYLNDQRIQSAPLNDGDCLRIGNYTLTVKLRGQDCILSFKQITKT